MQTFLLYPSFERTARCLDRQRLGKQRSEAKTIIKILLHWVDGGNWKYHPATKMWQGHIGYLIIYYNTILDEWERRGYRNIKLKHMEISELNIIQPKWIGNRKFHASHRSNLLLKNPEYYGQFGWKEPPGLPYIWPLP